jgi:sugar lactone lactonase YvrE
MYAGVSLLATQNELGESPLWHPAEQALYWVDFQDCPRIYRWQPTASDLQVFSVPMAVSAIAWRRSSGFIAATRGGIAFWQPESGLTLLNNPEVDDPRARLNDGAVDRQGRFWVGSMQAAANTSSLFRYDPGGGLLRMDAGFIVGNGLGWSPDGRTMYFTDSLRRAIFAYDFDPSFGHVSNRRSLIDTSDEPGVPDGLAVDTDGGIWSAFSGGWKVTRYMPDGRKDVEIALPVERPTSCAFGGSELKTLFITTSWGLIRQTERSAQPLAGNLFCVEPGCQGLPEPGFAG